MSQEVTSEDSLFSHLLKIMKFIHFKKIIMKLILIDIYRWFDPMHYMHFSFINEDVFNFDY
jgi:hypothetical protein